MSVDQLTSILTVAVLLRGGADRRHVEREISRILEIDPSIRGRLDQGEGQLVLGGDDELELEAISQRNLKADCLS
jgi:translation elongation factor EF-G